MHPRNLHQGRYDLQELTQVNADLKHFTFVNKYGNETIDFANADAVKSLNKALLMKYYGIKYWDIPEGYLCPPIPGRADYIHYLADLLEIEKNPSKKVRVLDVGTGSNCIYPVLGTSLYGWTFVGTDVDRVAIQSAKKIVQLNKNLQGNIQCRYQQSSSFIFKGMINEGEYFDAVMCNPPFHASAEEANRGSQRKWKNLKQEKQSQAKLNFGGKSNELWCEGGEKAFVNQMIKESVLFKDQCGWFTCLISKDDHVPKVYKSLKKVKPKSIKTIEMGQGSKKSRFVAWTFK